MALKFIRPIKLRFADPSRGWVCGERRSSASVGSANHLCMRPLVAPSARLWGKLRWARRTDEETEAGTEDDTKVVFEDGEMRDLVAPFDLKGGLIARDGSQDFGGPGMLALRGRCEQTVVPNLHEALGQNMEEEATHELQRLERGRVRAPCHEGDPMVVDLANTGVRNTYPVGIGTEIAEDVLGSGERGLDVDVPVDSVQGVDQEASVSPEFELAVSACLIQPGHKLPPKELPKWTHRKEMTLAS